MKRKGSLLISVMTVCVAIYLVGTPQKAVAQSQWQYASVSYFETELLYGYNPCIWIATECTSEKGSTCTEAGSKARGLVYCTLFHIENWR